MSIEIDISKVCISATDASVPEWKEEMLTYLRKYQSAFYCNAMTPEYKAFQQGQKNMLDNLIIFIDQN